MKKLVLFCLVGMICVCLPYTRVRAAEDTMPQLIRLHVSANGESLREQQAKIQVRDELLAYMEPLLTGVSSQEEALRLIKAHLAVLKEIVLDSLSRQGEGYGASLQLGEFSFPAKHYGTFTLPAGRYEALNVTLGSGEGRNWWCVVFPPLCLTSEVCSVNEGTGNSTFVLRSYFVEWWKRIFGRMAA